MYNRLPRPRMFRSRNLCGVGQNSTSDGENGSDCSRTGLFTLACLLLLSLLLTFIEPPEESGLALLVTTSHSQQIGDSNP